MEDLYDVVIVGAGLSALSLLHSDLDGARTLLLDYQERPGGFLRHLSAAPEFTEAYELLRTFRPPAGVTLQCGSTAVGLLPAAASAEPHTLIVRRKEGTAHIHARRVVIACGGLETPREHEQIPGTRPAGVITPILALQLLERGYLPGRRALVYGGSRYAIATARRLADAGMEILRLDPGEGCDAPAATLLEIGGFPRLERVRLNLEGRESELRVDTLVYAAGMLANTHWLKGSGIATRADGSIAVDARYQTNIPGIYAIGTVVAPSLDHEQSMIMGKKAAAEIRRSLA